MKSPYFNRQQRIAIYCDTMEGSHLMLNLAVNKLLRNVRITKGWLTQYKLKNTGIKIKKMNDFSIPQLFDSEGYHCDVEIPEIETDGKGSYTITMRDMGRSDKTVPETMLIQWI